MADAATWSKRITEWRGSGLTAREFCESRDFAVSGLYWWSSHLRRAARPGSSAPVRIARVVRRTSGPATESCTEAAPLQESLATAALPAPAVVIERDGFRVIVTGGVQRATLDTVLDALSARVRGRSI